MSTPSSITGDFRIDSHDIQKAVSIDHDQNGILTWDEIVSKPNETIDFLNKHLKISLKNTDCSINFSYDWELRSHFDADYALIPITLVCGTTSFDNRKSVTISFTGLYKQDPGHTVIVDVRLLEENLQGILSKQKQTITISTSNKFERLMSFVFQGAIHVAIGYDHLMFLFCLLISLVIPNKQIILGRNSENKQQELKFVLLKIIGIITTFSIAHSLTLGLAALGLIAVDSAWVELMIAASVFVAAINIIVRLQKFLYSLIFLFGLLHGLGYANALKSLQLSLTDQLLSILAFNIGVEIAQISIVCLTLPLLFILKNNELFAKFGLRISVLFAISISAFWFLTRIPAIFN